MGRKSLLILLSVVGLANVVLSQVVWEFGKDSKSSEVIAHNQGDISILNKVTNVQFSVPQCMNVNFVRVSVENRWATPAVTFNKYSNTVVISYLPLQLSNSKYDVIAKAKRDSKCGGGESKKKKKKSKKYNYE